MKENNVGFYELDINQLKSVEAGDVYENILSKIKGLNDSGDMEGFREYMKSLEVVLGDTPVWEALTKRGPLKRGEESRAKLLASMYGGNRELNLGGNNMENIFKPTKVVFPDNGGF